jgi:hypothetical protein
MTAARRSCSTISADRPAVESVAISVSPDEGLCLSIGKDSCTVGFVSDVGPGGTDGNGDGSVSNSLLSICNGGTATWRLSGCSGLITLLTIIPEGMELAKSVAALSTA